MASVPITSFLIESAPNGGFIQGTTADGKSFNFNRIKFDTLAAMVAVITGPNPEYDAEFKVFSCSARKVRALEQPLAITNSAGSETFDPSFS